MSERDERAGPVGSELDPVKSFAKYLPLLTRTLDEVTTAAAGLPGKSDLDFHRTMDRSFSKSLDKESQRVLRITDLLLKLVTAENLKTKGPRRGLQDEDDVMDGYRRGAIDVTDGLLEDADHALDELNGLKKTSAIKVDPAAIASSSSKLARPDSIRIKDGSYLSKELWHASHLAKPQLTFPDTVDNSVDRSPWAPSLAIKDYASVPLGHAVELDYELSPAEKEDTKLADRRRAREEGFAQNPYYYEIRHLTYPAHMFESAQPVRPQSFEETPFDFVDTPEQLDAMVQVLKGAKEIAVDLEHHSMRSYYGFTCLMQISVRGRDWIVDTLKLRGALRQGRLGGVLADPSIVKVFHGAKSDIAWLQRDFDIYVVNLFDTYHASSVLDFRPRSLAFLLSTYVSFDAEKRYQRADWRRRPLPAVMLKYARADTHFLLYIYDELRNALLELAPDGSAMRQVLQASEDTALAPYVREQADQGGMHRTMSTWLGPSASGMPGRVWRALWEWRDRTARELDESPSWILTNDMMKRLSLPTNTKTLLAIRALLKDSPIGMRLAADILKVIHGAQKASPRLPTKQTLNQPSADAPPSTEETARIKAKTPATVSKSQETAALLAASASAQPAPKEAAAGAHETHTALGTEKPNLWERMTEQPPVSQPVKSKMFGATLKSAPSAATETATPGKSKASSKLFGKTVAPKMGAVSSAFANAKAGIVAGLASPPPGPADSAQVPGKEQKRAMAEVESVPFVPGSQRTTTSNSADQQSKSTHSKHPQPNPPIAVDKPTSNQTPENGAGTSTQPGALSVSAVPNGKEIVQVKRKKNKKRARADTTDAAATASIAAPDPTPSSPSMPAKKSKKDKNKTVAKAEKGTKEIPAFDYKDVPNLLDNPGSAGPKARRKRDKKPKPAGITEDKFGKVPKDRSAPKDGARSGTFV